MTLKYVNDHLARPAAMTNVAPVVFIVDDDISVRESLELLVQHEGWQPKLFESACEFLASPPVSVPSCIILDVNLPDLNGLDVQERIATQYFATPVIFVTGYGDVPMTVRAMKAGAAEFLTKPFSENELLEAVRKALDASRCLIDRDTKTTLLKERFELLTKREREVMNLIVTGLMNKQVAGELDISEITVKAHRGKMMQKMQARSFADLVSMAAELGFNTGAKK